MSPLGEIDSMVGRGGGQLNVGEMKPGWGERG